MTHPEELLAPYVDGTASDQERAAVETHLPVCARCRAEVAQATAARQALKGLPVVEAPGGLAPDVATAPAAAASGGTPGWYRWGGIAAAAAAIVLALTFMLPRLGGGGSSTDRAASPAAATGQQPEAAGSPVPIQIQRADLGKDALTALVASADTAAGTPAAPGASPVFGEASSDAKVGTPAQAQRAQACLQTAFVTVPGTLVRLIAAPFDGKPAYIGLYEEGPGAGQPADMVVARAASAQTCTPLSFAQARLGG